MTRDRLDHSGESSALPVPATSGAAVILCDSVALAQALSQALHPLSTETLDLAEQSNGGRSAVSPTLIIVVELRSESAIAVLRGVKSSWPGVPTLLVGVSGDPDVMLACVAAGADGVVGASEGLLEVREAIDGLARGGLRLPPSAMRRLFERMIRAETKTDASYLPVPAAPLSARERQILSLLALGKPNKEIAAQIGIAEQTVKNHVGRVLHKLGVHSRIDAVRVAKLSPF